MIPGRAAKPLPTRNLGASGRATGPAPSRTSAIVPLLAACALLVLALPAAAGEIHPWIERSIEQAARSAPVFAAPQRAGRAAVEADGRILCWITCDDTARPDAWTTEVPGCRIEGQTGPWVQARVPYDEVHALARQSGVLYVGLPPRPFPLVQSEGLDSMRVERFWSFAGRGERVRIGVLDVGFAGYQSLLGSELPSHVVTKSFYTGTGGSVDITGGGEVHGTACAEIVHDVAPEAELYLANVATPVDLQNATKWMVDQGVEVISHSVGWFFGAGDGTGPIDEVASSARAAGVLWVNASGNFGMSHWSGAYRDADGDRYAEVDSAGDEEIPLPGVSLGPGETSTTEVILLWDEWPLSRDLAFNLDLVSGNGVVAKSEDFGEEPYAYRYVAWQSSSSNETLSLKIRLTLGTGAGHLLRVYRLDYILPPAFQVPEGSLAMPADSPDVLSVGAFRWDGTLEPYSSRGPTTDGRRKPEILGPDFVSTATYGQLPRGAFPGTSAATPHVAAAAGLLLGSAPHGGLFDLRWNLPDVLRVLQLEAGPVPDELDPDAVGWGRVRLPIGKPSATGPTLLVTRGSDARSIRLRLLDPPPRAAELQIFDVSGRLRGVLQPERLGGGVLEWDPRALQDRLRVRGRFWALEPVSRARASFYWPGERWR